MYQKTTLENGLRVISEKIPHVKSATIGIWVDTGARNEDSHNLGITHFIEHLLFKGSKQRTARQIAETVDAVGGQLNAFTAKEYTCYYIKVIDQHLPLAIDILSDMVFHPKFDPGDIEKEREVVLEEIYMYEDAPDEIVHDLYLDTVWPNHPLGRNILGTLESVSAVERSAILDYYQQYYAPDNMVLAAAGNIEHDELVALAKRFFAMSNKRGKIHIPESPVFKSDVLIKHRDTEQMHICLGTRGLSIDNEQAYALNVLNTIIGGGLSSRLFQSIREDRGLAYSVYSYLSSYRDAGLFTVYAGTRPNNAELVIELIQKEMIGIRQQGITAEELQRAKEYIKGTLLLGLENMSSRMTRLGKLELTLNRVVSVEEVVSKVEQVSQEDIHAIAQNLFVSDGACLATLGPAKINGEIIL